MYYNDAKIQAAAVSGGTYHGQGLSAGNLAGMDRMAREPDDGQPQLARTSERLHMCISELGGLVADLEKRLDGVLNPITVNKCLAEVALPQPVRCPLGVSMDARSDEVYAITCRVRDLLDRLAL